MIEFIGCVYDLIQEKTYHYKFTLDKIEIPMIGKLSMTEAQYKELRNRVKEFAVANGIKKPLWAVYAHRKVEDTQQSTLIMGLQDIRMDFAAFVVGFLREEGFYD